MTPDYQPQALYTAEQCRALDACAIHTHGIPGGELMQRAGAACMEVISAHWPEARKPLVICGAGNNGGDGWVVARLFLERAIKPVVYYLVPPAKLSGDAADAAERYLDAGGEAVAWNDQPLDDCDLIVDAILGTGVDRDLGGDFKAAVDAINQSPAAVLSADIPTGLNADTGAVFGTCVRASATVTFIGRKRGLYTGQARDVCGPVLFDALAVPAAVYESVMADAWLDDGAMLARRSHRRRTAHKGTNGRLLVIGGNKGMPGSVRLSGEAAMRSGAGMVFVATHDDHAAQIALSFPPLMSGGFDSAKEKLSWANAIAIGPGLGTQAESDQLFGSMIDSGLPMVIDADALNLLSDSPRSLPENSIITPHPGEAARLLATSATEVEADRYGAARELAKRFSCVCVLKGAGTVVGDAKQQFICSAGNPGMATAGSGDVLTGVIGALLAGGTAALHAARMGVMLHAVAGDQAALEGEIGMTAMDLIEQLRSAANA